MNFNFKDCVQVDSARERLEHLIKIEAENVEILKKKKVTTYPQKQYLHLIRHWFGLETGYTSEEVEAIYKLQVNKDIYVTTSEEGKLPPFPYIRDTKELTTEESALCITRFRNFSQMKVGVYLPSRSEETALLSISNAMKEHSNRIWIK